MRNGSPARAVFLFCVGEDDPVAPHVLARLSRGTLVAAQESFALDHAPGRMVHDRWGNELHFVATTRVASRRAGRYALQLRELGVRPDVVAVVNWHEGGNAPSPIFAIHRYFDFASCSTPRSVSGCDARLLEALQRRCALDGTAHVPLLEASHYTGMLFDGDGDFLRDEQVDWLDVEIGSDPTAWSSQAAVEALADALLEIFRPGRSPTARYVCLGGRHFEPSLTDVVTRADAPADVLLHMPERWLVEHTTPDRIVELLGGLMNTPGFGQASVAVHRKLKAPFKDAARALARLNGEQICNFDQI